MSGGEQGEKAHEPTQKRLEDARRRGEVVRSAEITLAAAYAGLLLAALISGPAALSRFGVAATAVIEQVEANAQFVLNGGASAAGRLVAGMLVPTLPFFAFPALGVVMALVAQRAVVLTPQKLAPRIARIDPLATARQKFGPDGLFEFAKSTAKLCVFSLLLGWFLVDRLPRALLAQGSEAGTIAAEFGRMTSDFLLLVLVTAAAAGTLDYIWQHYAHLRRNRMSRQELMEEFKEAEGDPHVKGQRRRQAEAIAMNRMLADVPKADVVIVNPTHYAVALRWDRSSRRAPLCIAKGVDDLARRIRERAATAGVPIRSDPPTARAIYASVEIGHEILPQHYAPVAAAIRFAEAMRRRARERRRR
ncbi:MAG: flagellar biosynthesis protein FlhB [Albidovulum sp.]